MAKKNEMCWGCKQEIKPGELVIVFGHYHRDCWWIDNREGVAKAKGKRVERLIRDIIKEACSLDDQDIRITIGAENGADLKLSKELRLDFLLL